MASLRKRGKVWYFRFTDADGVKRERKGCPDRRETEAMARAAENEAAKVRSGLIDPRDQAYRDHAARSLADHLTDFIAHLRHLGREPRYIQQVEANVERILNRAGIKRLSDLTPERVAAVLATLRDEGLSLQTVNHSLRHIKQFSRWLAVGDRTRKDDLARLKGFNVQADRRHDRRELSEAELAALIRAAERGPVVLGMTGPDRAMVYRVAVGTGFRAGELRSLSPDSFHLDDNPPAIICEAGYTKNGRQAEQPITSTLAALLRSWIASKPTGRPVFKLPEKAAKMLRVDLEAAGIAYRDPSGRVADFHCLRHTYVSMVVRGGASLKTAMELARHGSADLTIGRYSHVALFDKAAALAGLPDLNPEAEPYPEATVATGTDGGYINNPFAHRRGRRRADQGGHWRSR